MSVAQLWYECTGMVGEWAVAPFQEKVSHCIAYLVDEGND